MDKTHYEKAKKLETEIENIKEVIVMLESRLTLKLKCEMMFTAY